MGKTEKILTELGIILPHSNPPAANYVPYVQFGNMIHVSGQTTRVDGAMKITGKVGSELTTEQGIEAAKICAINLISQIKQVCDGDLDRVKKVIKIGVYVNSAENFTEHSQVANGASDLIVNIFGKAGKHARTAIGCNSLPGNSAVEVEGIFEIDLKIIE